MMRKLFDIPIYSTSEKKFNIKWSNYDKKIKKELFVNNPETYDSHIELFPDSIRKWKYNQIIGYIVVSYMDNSIWFDLYLTSKKKIIFSSNKKNIIENMLIGGYHFQIMNNDTNEDIIDRIKLYIRIIKKEYLKNRYLDLEVFHNIIKIIDFKKIK